MTPIDCSVLNRQGYFFARIYLHSGRTADGEKRGTYSAAMLDLLTGMMVLKGRTWS